MKVNFQTILKISESSVITIMNLYSCISSWNHTGWHKWNGHVFGEYVTYLRGSKSFEGRASRLLEFDGNRCQWAKAENGHHTWASPVTTLGLSGRSLRPRPCLARGKKQA